MLTKGEFFIFNSQKFLKKNFNCYLAIREVKNKKVNFFLNKRCELFAIKINFKYFFNIFLQILSNYNSLLKKCYIRKNIFLLILMKINSYKGIRHFFCLPCRGGKTWSSKKSQIKNNSSFLTYYRQIYFSESDTYYPKLREKFVIYIEFLNKLWYRQFYKEWVFAKNRRREYVKKNAYVRWQYDLKSALRNSTFVFLEKNYKKNKNRKKIKIKNNLFNVGFYLNFTSYLFKKIFK